MPRYNVGVHGDDLDRASDALEAGGISIGRIEAGGSGAEFDGLVARVDAETPDAAIARVREQLPPDGGYALGPTATPPLPPEMKRRLSRRSEGARLFRALELQRALVAEPQSSNELRVQAVNLYEDAVRVDYVLPPGIDRDPPENWDSTHMLLNDDLGTEYYPGGGGSGGRGGPGVKEITHGYDWFTPAVPEAARRLTVATLFGEVTLDL